MSDDSVTTWISALKAGDSLAADKLWRQYYERLMRLARGRLGNAPRRVADEEDVALSAFHSFCTRAAANRFPDLNDRHDLWALLVTITARKALAVSRGAMRQKRGGGKVRGESVFAGGADLDDEPGIGQVIGEAPTPEFAAMVAEEFDGLLNKLDDDVLRQIALKKLEGFTDGEAAESLGLSERTVRRKLQVIRTIWEDRR